MAKRRTRSRSRSAATRKRGRSKSADPFASRFKKRRMKRKSITRRVQPKRAAKSRKRAKTAQVSWKRVPRDPRVSERKKVSASATSEPTTEAAIVKKYRPQPTAKQQAHKRHQKVKKFLTDSKNVAKKIGAGIEETAKTAAKISQFIEPFLDAAALEYPVLAPAAIANTGVAEVSKMIEHTGSTAERGRDAYKALTDTGKYQKMIEATANQPKVDLIQYDPRAIPLPIEEID